MELTPIEKSKRQIPDWRDNLKKEGEEQVVIIWKSFPSATEAKGYRPFKYDEKGDVVLVYNDKALILDHMDHIENLKIGKPSITPEDLVNHEDLRLEPLVTCARRYALDDGDDTTEGEKTASE